MEESAPTNLPNNDDIVTPRDSLEQSTTVNVSSAANTGTSLETSAGAAGLPSTQVVKGGSNAGAESGSFNPSNFGRNKILRKILMVSAIFVGFILLLVAGTFIYQKTHKASLSQADQVTKIKDQNVQLSGSTKGEGLPSLRVGVPTLFVNGDISANGILRVSNSSNNYGQFTLGTLTQNQTYTLPNASGTICLDVNNCDFVKANSVVSSIAGVQGAFTLGTGLGLQGSTIINTTQVTPATITRVNGFTGNVTIQGTNNQVGVSAGGNVITLTTPQDIGTSSSPTFGGLNVSGNVVLATTSTLFTNILQQTASGHNLILNAGTDNIVLNANGVQYVLPAGGPASQTICTTMGNCGGGGGGQTVLLGPVGAQNDNSGNTSINIDNTGGSALIDLQANGSSKFSVANNGDTSIAGILNVNTITPTGGLTVGSTSQNLILQGNANASLSATNGGFTTTLGFVTPTANVTYNLPTATAGTYSICTSTGNCASVGGGVTTTGGTAGRIAKFTGAQTIADSLLSEAGGTVTVNGNGIVQGSFALGVANSATGAITLQNSSNANTITLTSAAATSNQAITIPNASGTLAVSASGNIALNATGNISFTGLLPIANGGTNANSIGAAGTIAYSNGTAFAFNSAGSSNQILTSGGAGAPTFQNIASLLTAGTNISITGTTNATVGTIANPNFATSVTTPLLTSSGALNITPGGAFTLGATGQTFTLQGTNASTITATGGGFTTSVGFNGVPTGAVTYNFDRAATPGTYNICTSVGNCAGAGGGVTTPGGTAGKLAKFTGGSSIADSILSESAGIITNTGGEVIQGAAGLTLGVASTTSGGLTFFNAGGSGNISLQAQNPGASSFTITLPNQTGTVCLTSGNCAGIGGTGDILNNGNTFGAPVKLGTNDAQPFQFETQGQIQATIAVGGATTFKNFADSSAAFQVQNALGNEIFTIDTSGGKAILGKASTINGALVFNNSTNSNAITLNSAVATGARSITVPDASGTLAVSASGNIALSAAGNITFTGQLPVANGGTGSNTLAANGVLVGNGTSPVSSVVAGGSGLCLVSTAGAPTWSACTGLGGVDSLDTLSGALTLANSSGVGTTITIDNATTLAKGIASFNGTNFTVTGGAVNTIQDINTSATPTFGGLTLSTALGIGSGGTNTGTLGSAGTVAFSNGTSYAFTAVGTSGQILTSGGAGTPTFQNIASLLTAGSNIAITGTTNATVATVMNPNFTTSVTTPLLQSTGALNITPGGALTVGATGQQFTLQGNASSVISATNGGNTTTVGFVSPTANVSLFFPTLTAGSYQICTDSGNCAGVGATLQTAYNFSLGGTTSEIKLDSTRGALDIQDANSTIGANLLNVRASNGAGQGSILFGVGNTGVVTLQDSADSNSAFRVFNALGTNTVLNADTANGRVTINGTTPSTTAALQVQSTSASDVVSKIQGFTGQTADLQQMIDANGNVLARTDAGGNLVMALEPPKSALTASPTGVGNLNGTYSYVVTYVSASGGETTAGVASSNVATSGSQQMSLTNIPIGPTGTVARKIYRTTPEVDGVTTNWRFLTQISNNTATTFTDNVLDTTLNTSPLGYAPPMPVAPPITATPSAANGVAGALTGAYQYEVTFITPYGETAPSTPTVSVTAAGNKLNLTGLAMANIKNVTAMRIYRTKAGGSTFFYVPTLNNVVGGGALTGTITDPGVTGVVDNTADGSLNSNITPPTSVNTSNQPAAPSAALHASTGNLVSGLTYMWAYTYVNASGGESALSPASNVLITDNTHEQADISGISAGPAGTVSRRLYRAVISNPFFFNTGQGGFTLVTTLNDNSTTTYLDNIADNALTLTYAPTTGFVTPGAAVNQLKVTAPQGQPPLVVTSTTQVNNLNVQYLGGSDQEAITDFILNGPESLKHIRAALANTNSTAAVINVLGDSIMWGTQSSNIATKSTPAVLNQKLQAKYGDGGTGFQKPYQNSLYTIGTTGYYPGQTYSGTGGGSMMVCNSTTNSGFGAQLGGHTIGSGVMTLSGIRGSTINIIYTNSNNDAINYPNLTSLFYSIDNGAITGTITQNTTNTTNGLRQTISGLNPSVTHTIVLTSPTGGDNCGEIDAIEGTFPTGVRVNNVATAGNVASFTYNANSPYIAGFSPAPSLVIMDWGTNDLGAANESPITFKNSYQQYIDQIKAANVGADCLLVTPPPHAGPYRYSQSSFNDVIYQLAQENGCAVMDTYRKWNSSFTWATGQGLMADALHPSDKGYADMASSIFEAIGNAVQNNNSINLDTSLTMNGGRQTFTALSAPTNLAANPFNSVAGSLTPSNTFRYVVTATNTTGESMASSELNVAVGASGSIALSWTPVSGATGYRLYRCVSTGCSAGTESQYIDLTSPVYTDDGTASWISGFPPGSSGNNSGAFGGIQLQGASVDALRIANSNNASIINVDTSLNPNNLIANGGFEADPTSNLLTNSDFEINSSMWAAKGSATVARDGSTGYKSGASLKATTTAAANDGMKYPITLSNTTKYELTFFAKISSGSGSVLDAGYANDGSTDTTCSPYSTSISTTWVQYQCIITTTTTSGSPFVYIKQTDATARGLYVDNVSLKPVTTPTGWTNKGNASVYSLRQTTTKYAGAAAMMIQTTANNGDGVKYPVTLTAGTTYSLSFQTMTNSLLFGTMEIGYSTDGSTDTSCNVGIGLTNGFITDSCTFTPGSITGSTYIYIKQVDTTSRRIYIDSVDLEASSVVPTFSPGTISLNGMVTSPVLLRNNIDSNTAFNVQNSAGSSLFDVDTTNGTVTVSSTLGNANTFNVKDLAGTTDFRVDGFNKYVIVDNASSGATLSVGNPLAAEPSGIGDYVNWTNNNCQFGCFGFNGTTTINSTSPLAGGTNVNAVGGIRIASAAAAASLANAYSVAQMYGILVSPNTAGSNATVASNTGVYIQGQTTGTSAYGLIVDQSTTQTLWLDSLTSPTSASAGILFGQNNPANLYRSASSTLKTDSNYVVGQLLGFGVLGTTDSNTILCRNSQNNLAGCQSLSISSGGAATFQNVTNSNQAFTINNSSGVSGLNVSTLSGGQVNLVANPDFEQTTNGWVGRGNAVLSVTQAQAQFGRSSMSLGSLSASGDGVEYRIPLIAGGTYFMSFWARSSVSHANYSFGHTDNGSDSDCLSNQTIGTSWTQYTCSFTAGGTINTTSSIYFKQTSAQGGTIFIDGVTLNTGSSVLNYVTPGAGLQVEPYYNNVAINIGGNGEIQPWQSAANQLPNVRSQAAVTTANGYIYAMGGGTGTAGASVQNTVYYAKGNVDGSLGSWNSTSTLGTGVSGGAAVVVNGYIYVIGGKDSGSTTQALVQFAKLNSDGTTGTWSTTTSIPAARFYAGAIANKGFIYVIGGNNSGDQTSIYYAKVGADGKIGSWTTSGNSLGNAWSGGQPALVAGTIYVTGGGIGSGANNNVQSIPINADGSVGTVNSSLTSLSTTLHSADAVGLNGYLYTLGGIHSGNNTNVVIYDQINSDSTIGTAWQTAGQQLPTPGTGNLTEVYGGAVTLNGYIYYVGGDTGAAGTKTIYYTSGPRTRIAGSLDLTGNTSDGLNDATNEAGSITAGNGRLLGSLYVANSTDIGGSLNVAQDLHIGGTALFQPSINSTTAFQLQDSSGNSLLNVDSGNANFTFNGANKADTQIWNTTTALSTAQTAASAAYGGNGYVYLMGGNNGSSTIATVTQGKVNVDGSISAWSTSSIALTAVRQYTTSVAANGFIYTLGGSSDASTTTTAVNYARVNADGTLTGNGGGFLAANALPVATKGGRAAIANGYIYFVGGDTANNADQSNVTATTNVYYAKLNADGSVGSWQTSANSLPAGRAYSSVVVANGFLYVMGGYASGATTTTNSVYYSALNASTGAPAAFSTSGNNIPASIGGAATYAQNGYVYVVGGAGSANSYYGTLNATTGDISGWTQSANSLPAARSHTSYAQNGGYFYDISGSNAGAQTTVYFASTARTKIAGTLDLTGIGGGNIAAGSSAGSLIAGNTTVAGTLNVSGPSLFSNNVGISGGLSIQNINTNANTAGTENTTAESINLSRTGATGGTLTTVGINLNVGGDGAGAGTQNVIGVNSITTGHADTVISLAGGVLQLLGSGVTTATAVGVQGSISTLFDQGTTTNAYALQGQINLVGGGGTYGTTEGLNIQTALAQSGATITNNYGVHILTQTAATNNYGLAVETASTQTVWIASNDASATTAAKGIAFGSARDVNLYRGNTGNLRTDSSLSVGTSSTSSTVNLINNPSFESVTNINSNINTGGWVARGSGTVTIAQDFANFGRSSTKIVTGTSSGNGAEYRFPFTNQAYSLSFWARRDTSSAASFNIGYNDGADHNCLTNQTLNTTWTQFTCANFTPTGPNATSSFYIVQSDTATDNIYIDGVTLVTGATALNYTDPGTGLEVQPYYQQTTINAGGNGEVQPWQLASNPLPGARSRPGITTANGYIYVLGGGTGVDGGTAIQNTVLYAKANSDGSLSSWTTNSNNLNTGVNGGEAVVVNGYIYLVGGRTTTANTSASTTVQFAKLNNDGSTGTWSTTTALPAVRSRSAVVTANGYIYVAGGEDGTPAKTTTVYIARVGADGKIASWTTSGNTLTNGGTADTQGVVAGGYMYMIGGDLTGTTSTQYAKLNGDGTTGTWASATSLPASRGDVAAVAMNGFIYELGGFNATTITNSVQYNTLAGDGSLGAWNTAANQLPVPNSSAPGGIENAQAVVVNGYVYVIGGDDNSAGRTTVYYTSGPRTRMYGSLDLIGNTGSNLNDATNEAGSITAGNGNFLGNLYVANAATIDGSLAVDRDLRVGGQALFIPTTASTTAFQIQNNSGTTIFDVDTTNGRVGIGTNAPGSDFDLQKTSSSTTPATETALNVNFTDTGAVTTGTTEIDQGQSITLTRSNAVGGTSTSIATYGQNIAVTNTSVTNTASATDTTIGSRINVTRSGATNGTINTTGLSATVTSDNAGSGTGNGTGVSGTSVGHPDTGIGVAGSATALLSGASNTLIGVQGTIGVFADSGTTTSAYALQGSVQGTAGSTGTMTTAEGLNIQSPALGGGSEVFTHIYGIHVLAQSVLTGGTDAFGIAVEAATTQTLWVSSNADNTTAAAGIGFGSSRDTTLYRGGAATLATNATTLRLDGTGATTIQTQGTNAGSTNSKDITLQSGNAAGTTSNSGNVTIDAGTATGTVGTVALGTTNARTINIGSSPASGTVSVTIKGGNSTTPGGVNVTLGSTASTGAVCSSLTPTNTPVAGTAYELRDCSGAPQADFAEMYPTAAGLEVGDVVAPNTTMVNTYDTGIDGNVDWNTVKGQVPQLDKETKAYSSTTFGIVSDNHSDFASTGYNVKDGDHPMSIALTGRVLVKISTENGNIAPGDFITASATKPGYAMKATKAGYVIGQALDFYSGSADGKVMVFARTAYYPGPSPNDTLGSDPTFNSIITGSLQVNGAITGQDLNISGTATVHNLSVTGLANVAQLTVTGDAHFQGNLYVEGHLSSGTQNAMTIDAGAAACAAPTVTVTGNDTAGVITITTGSGCTDPGILGTVHFTKPFGRTPHVVITPTSGAGADLKYFNGSTTNNAFTIDTNSAPTAATTYTYNYFVIE